MKKTLAVVSASILAFSLAACGGGDSTSEETTPSATGAPSAPPQDDVDVAVGETITLVQDVAGSRQVELTIEDISVSEQCHHGHNDYTDSREDGGYYIQLTGEMDAIAGERGYQLSETWMTGTTADGYAVTFSPAFSCMNPEEVMPGYQAFDNRIIAGQKARGVLEFWAEELPATITLVEPYEPTKFTWQVPEPSTPAEPAESAAEERHTPSPTLPAAPEAPAAPAEPAEPAAPAPVVGFTGAPGHDQPRVLDKTIASCGDPALHQPGTTFFTDGTSGWTEQCQNQMTQ